MGAIEIKAGATIASDWFNDLGQVSKALPQVASKTIVYGGTERQSRKDVEVVPLTSLATTLDRIAHELAHPDFSA